MVTLLHIFSSELSYVFNSFLNNFSVIFFYFLDEYTILQNILSLQRLSTVSTRPTEAALLFPPCICSAVSKVSLLLFLATASFKFKLPAPKSVVFLFLLFAELQLAFFSIPPSSSTCSFLMSSSSSTFLFLQPVYEYPLLIIYGKF